MFLWLIFMQQLACKKRREILKPWEWKIQHERSQAELWTILKQILLCSWICGVTTNAHLGNTLPVSVYEHYLRTSYRFSLRRRCFHQYIKVKIHYWKVVIAKKSCLSALPTAQSFQLMKFLVGSSRSHLKLGMLHLDLHIVKNWQTFSHILCTVNEVFWLKPRGRAACISGSFQNLLWRHLFKMYCGLWLLQARSNMFSGHRTNEAYIMMYGLNTCVWYSLLAPLEIPWINQCSQCVPWTLHWPHRCACQR